MEKIKVLYAEDESALAMIVKESLETRSFEVTLATNGIEALSAFEKQEYDIVVLDVMMPLKDGFTVAKEIRKVTTILPILFLTAKSQTHDVIEGFTIGCNDYVKKPFSIEELIVRIKSLVNRNELKRREQISIGKFIFDTKKQTLQFEDTIQKMTHRESQLLELLVEHLDEVVERKEILIKIWKKDDFFNGRSMDVFITKLRKKLQYDASIEIINSRGQGYKITIT